MRLVQTLGLTIVVILLTSTTACCQTIKPQSVSQKEEVSVSMPKVIWQEGEDFDFVTQTEVGEMEEEHELPASGSKVLYRNALQAAGNIVTYELDIPADMADAKIIFRYARPWLPQISNTPVNVTLVGPLGTDMQGPTAANTDVDFKTTSSWGARPIDHDLKSVSLGDLTKGKYSLKLTALADNITLTIDGFFIASGDFQISSDELDPLIRVKIASNGYVGLRRASIVVRQEAEKCLSLTARSFDPAIPCVLAEASITDFDGAETPLTAQQGATDGTIKLDVSTLADGEYVLKVRMAHPTAEFKTILHLAGKFLGALDENIAKLTAARETLKTSENAVGKQCELDLENAVEFLTVNKSKFMAATSLDESVRKDSMKDFVSYVRDPKSLLLNMRKTEKDSLETLARLDASEAPYEGRFGELRRGYHSTASGKVEAYRVFVPTSYATAEKVPLILMLHGGGDDENYFPNMQNGMILRELEKRGYLAIMPKWDTHNVVPDMPELIERTIKEYPKIDPDRVYCTGFSMGGFGTYNLTTSRPDLFAAAVCVAGTGDVELAVNLKNVPTLILQGEADSVILPEGAQKLAAKLKELGYVVGLHMFPNVGHDYVLPDYINLSLDFFDKYTRKQ